MGQQESEGIRSLTIVFFGFLVAYFLTFVLNLFLARRMSPAAFGDFNVAVSAIWTANILCLLGLDTYILKAMPRLAKDPGRGQVRAYYRRCLRVVLLAALALLTVGLSLYFGYILFGNGAEHHPVLVVLVVYPVFALTYFYSRLFLSVDAPGNGVLSSIIIPGVALALMVAANQWLGLPMGEFEATVFFVAAWFIALAVYWVAWRRHPHMAEQQASLRSDSPVVQESLPFLIGSFFSGAIVYIILLAAELLVTGENEIGHLSAIMQIAYPALLILVTTKVVYIPRISVRANGPRAYLNAESKNYFRASYFLFAIYLILVVLVGSRVLELFGSEYAGLHGELVLISVGMSLNMFVLMSGSILQCIDAYRLVNIVYVSLTAAILVLMGVLDPYAGGVASVGWALLFPGLIAYLVFVGWGKRRLGLRLY